MIFRTKWAKVDGTLYKRNATVIVSKDEDIEVLIISKILIVNRTKIYFYGNCYKFDLYHRHYRAHTLTDLKKHIYVCYHQLHHHIAMHPRTARVLPHDTIIICYNCIIVLIAERNLLLVPSSPTFFSATFFSLAPSPFKYSGWGAARTEV